MTAFFFMILVWSCNFWYHPDIYLSYNYRTTLIKRSCLCCYMEWDTQFVTSHAHRVHFFFFFLASTIIKDKNLNILFPPHRWHAATDACVAVNEGAVVMGPTKPSATTALKWAEHTLPPSPSPPLPSVLRRWVGEWTVKEVTFLSSCVSWGRLSRTAGEEGGIGALCRRRAAASAAGAPQTLCHRWCEEVPLPEVQRAGEGVAGDWGRTDEKTKGGL